jgi:hypothetical protein
VNNQLEQYNKAIIIDCHSYPEIPIERSLVKSSFRPDFNIGTDAYHTPQELIDISVDFFNRKGYSLGIDLPYTGSIVPLEHYQKNKNVQSIMLEINRKLYLKEDSNERSENFEIIKNVTREFIKEIKKDVDMINTFGTSIFRDLNPNQKKEFLNEFEKEIGFKFTICTLEEENENTVYGVLKNINYARWRVLLRAFLGHERGVRGTSVCNWCRCNNRNLRQWGQDHARIFLLQCLSSPLW